MHTGFSKIAPSQQNEKATTTNALSQTSAMIALNRQLPLKTMSCIDAVYNIDLEVLT